MAVATDREYGRFIGSELTESASGDGGGSEPTESASGDGGELTEPATGEPLARAIRTANNPFGL